MEIINASFFKCRNLKKMMMMMTMTIMMMMMILKVSYVVSLLTHQHAWTAGGKAKPADVVDLDIILRTEREKEEIKKDTTEVYTSHQ